MTDTNYSASLFLSSLLSALFFPRNEGSLNTDGLMIQHPYDKWLRPRPNTHWQNLENQTFADYTELKNVQFDDAEEHSEEEEGDTTEETSNAEGSDSEGGDWFSQAGHGAESMPYCAPSSDRSQPTDDEGLQAGIHTSGHFNCVGSEEASNNSTVQEVQDSVEQDDDIVARFLTVMEDLAVKDQDLHRDSIDRLRQFFRTATIMQLEKASKEDSGSRIILEDRNFSGKTFRPYRRSMTPKELHDALARKRYPATNSSKLVGINSPTRDWGQRLRAGFSFVFPKANAHRWPVMTSGWGPCSAGSRGTVGDAPTIWVESEDCQVERRTLYVSNPSKWTALVLAATASPTQAPALFDFIDRYLKFETSISVNINPYLARMTLSFHLPFYTCRGRSYTDSRQDHEDYPLRKSFELPCMNLAGSSQDSPPPRRWICESQVSLLVSIVDLYGWTAYAFEDTYYKACEPTEYWDSFCSMPDYYYPDALTSGTLDSTRFLDPRMYFLKVLETRIYQAYREWRVVVDTMDEIVKRHRPDRIFNQSTGFQSRRASKRDKQILLQQRYSEWISNMTAVVSDQSGQISTTLTAWDEFEKRSVKYFPEDTNSPLETSIGPTFAMIKLLKDRLDSLSQEITRDQSALSAQLAVENTGTAKFVKALTVISIVMMPMVLDIALFSIQPGVMPFQMDFLAFVKSYFALALFFCVVWVILSQWDTFVMFAYLTFERMDSAVKVPSTRSSGPTHRGHGEGEGNSHTGMGEGNTEAENSVSTYRRSVWGRFSAGLLLKRGQQEASTTAVDPAGLTAIVYV